MVPEGWRSCTYNDVVELNPETLATSTPADYTFEYLDIGSISRPGKVGPTKRLRFSDAPSRARRRVRAGDTIVSMVRPYLRSFAFLAAPPGDMVVSTGFAVLRPKEAVDPLFIYQTVLRSEFVDFLVDRQTGSNYPAVSAADVSEAPLLIPPLSEQRKIVAILFSIDDAIEKTEAVIEQLEVVKLAMLEELLMRGLPGRYNRFKTTEAGEILEAWRTTEIGAVCERMFVGIAQAATHAYVTLGGVPIIRTTNVRPNQLRKDDVLRISSDFADAMRSKALRTGDVLTARTGYPGTSVVVPEEYDGAQCFTLLVSRPGPELVSSYLCHLMNSSVGQHIVSRGQAGGAQQNLNVTVLQKAKIALPPVSEQEEIATAIDCIYHRLATEVDTLSHLNHLKRSMMAVLLTGALRVPPSA
jgi:type I restriction enzyme S subunit